MLLKHLLEIVANPRGALDVSDPVALRYEADRIELEQVLRKAL